MSAPLVARRRCARAAVLLLALAACEPADAPDPVRRGGTVVVATQNDLGRANPLVAAEGWTHELNRFALFVPLVRYDSLLSYQPALARAWEMDADSGVVFHLRDDVRWHDGRATTAHDVAFTFERAKDPETGFPNAEYFAHWHDVEVLDSLTVRFRLEPHVDPLAGWPFTPIAPKHLLDTIPAARMRQAAFNKAPVGNGPFRFVSQRTNDRWVFEANPEFPQGLGGPPLIDRLVIRVIPEPAAQIAEIEAGEVDLALAPGADQVKRLDEADGLSMIVRPSTQSAFIAWNGQRPPLDDPRVRRAFTMAIDRRAMIEGLRDGFGELAVGPVPPFHWAYDPSVRPLPHAPDSARTLLAAAGWVDRDGDGILEDEQGQDLSVELKVPSSNDYNRDLGELIIHGLNAVGVRATLRLTEGTTLIADLVSPSRRFDGALLAWEGDYRLNLRDLFHSEALGTPYQFASYANPEVDSLLDAANRTFARERAKPLWRRLQQIMREEQPWTFLFHQPQTYVKRDRLRGVHTDIRGAFVTVADWWLADLEPEPTP